MTAGTTMSLAQLADLQRGDGSWGSSEEVSARIIPTIFAVRSVQEAEAAGGELVLDTALDFLQEKALVDGGGAARGTRDSVLSCYTGMLALILLRAGRHDSARPLLEWIVRYQPVAFGGKSYLHLDGPAWGAYLKRRYGGCMAGTTCLLGLVPAVAALAHALAAGLGSAGDRHEAAFRDLLTDRRLMFGRSRDIIPLAGRTKADPTGTRWLLPAYPLDYVIDLIALVDVARRIGVPPSAMGPALDLIASWRLSSGEWPLLARRSVRYAYRPETLSRHRPSTVISGASPP